MKIRHISKNDLEHACKDMLVRGARFVMVYGVSIEKYSLELRYLINVAPQQFELWRCYLAHHDKPVSLANHCPLLGWYEREVMDLFGVEFLHHPEPYSLITHPEEFHYPDFSQQGLQYLPFGPIRAGIVESAEFDFFYAGESIPYFYQKLFFKHRGMEQRFCGLSADLGVLLAERVSGIGSVSHAWSYCQAVEKTADCHLSKRAEYSRIILAELERLYNHLHFFGDLCHATTLKVGAAEGLLLEERLKQINARVTGHRLLRHVLTPGGLRSELKLAGLKPKLLTLQSDIFSYLNRLQNTASHVDRLLHTGVVTKKMALDQGATGPIERAAGFDHDLRRDHVYSCYADFNIAVPVCSEGDAQARATVRMKEIEVSFAIILAALDQLPAGAIKTECVIKPSSEGLAWVESPRGGTFYAVHVDAQGKLARVKIKSASYSNWRVFPFTVHETGMMDFAINEASFGLSIAGCDR